MRCAGTGVYWDTGTVNSEGTRAEALTDLEQQTCSEADVAGKRIVWTQNGFRLQETEAFTVEVWKMLFYWCLVAMPPDQQVETAHGC